MTNTTAEKIESIATAQAEWFRKSDRHDIGFRKESLRKLKSALRKWQKPIEEALWKDLHKSAEEALLTETSIVLGEIDNHLRHIDSWASDHCRKTPLKLFPSRSRVMSEPLGNALIISPWNYPVQLLLNPLVGALSAGCTAVLKPSPYVPTVSSVIGEMISETFPEEQVAVVQGNREVNRILLQHRWDIIFFTGSPALGKQVMEAAAKNLTPVVL